MPKRTDIQSVLIIGAGPITIGQACEFDYSGVQACKALAEENYRVILVNSNPATIMTDPDFADATYIEPLNWRALAKVIKAERPDALLPTMGGQTGLNCALDLQRHGVLEEFGVEMIGADSAAIDKAEDRQLFAQAMRRIGLETVRGGIARDLQQAREVADMVGFPAIIRPSFTLGGSGGGVAYNAEEFDAICRRGFEASPTNKLLIEESIIGWKEFEMEVVRDRLDNCIIICSIENFDPMGVHTGDSITVAPAQTLTDKEYQIMRDASIAVLREIGVDTGGSNVQFAINPDDGRMIVIEMNPRVSRSSALASKATGFPIAKVAAKLAVGFTLDELANDITGGATPASFEPSIDYVVTKIPRFDFEKFPQADATLTTQMKSVGEVMAIGRTFQESFQKALRGLEIGADGLNRPDAPPDEDGDSDYEWRWMAGHDESGESDESADAASTKATDTVVAKLRVAGAQRPWYIAEAFRLGLSAREIYEACAVDPWFLAQIEELVETEKQIAAHNSVVCVMPLEAIAPDDMRAWKRMGFSDRRIARLLNEDEEAVRKLRWDAGIHPVFKRVDSCAAEFDTATAYMYSSYDEECEAAPTARKKIIILGGGPNRIGQGIEFDYCCVHAAMAMREDGYETIMVNCNPETVSTDYDTSDRLYFEPLTLEDVLEIARVEKPTGVIVQYGGQTPLKLSRALAAAGVPIIGTSPQSIHQAEDRAFFSELLRKLKLLQPPNRTATTAADALKFAGEIGYPLVVRPSYVLGGRAMEIVHHPDDLRAYMNSALLASFDSPVLLDRFLNDATEVDVDAICDGSEVLIGGIMEHIEEAGVHSGDSACSLPPFSLPATVQDELRRQTRAMALALNVVGLMNVQFAVKGADIYVLEVNPRASRTVPFVSKATSRPLAKIAARCMAGKTLAQQGVSGERIPDFYSVKEAVFPFIKFPGVDSVLGPEMKSTGEVMGVGGSFGEAFGKAQVAVGHAIPPSGRVLLSVKTEDQAALAGVARYLCAAGFELVATEGTAAALTDAGLPVQRVNKVKEGRPHVVDRIKNDEFAMIINTTAGAQSLKDSYTIRREALQHRVTYFTTLAAARAAVEAHKAADQTGVYRLQTLHERFDAEG
ncbi:MAG: carbamoyl-phosphate synthase large subunit [Gammaproteobacteria bacterium]|nr:carbamoyl-phosphate synthase large subunit [Gammaproteobacteria bacterium]